MVENAVDRDRQGYGHEQRDGQQVGQPDQIGRVDDEHDRR
jgi:hypothetical protein